MYNKLNTKVNNLQKVPDASALFQINEHNANKQNLEKKIGDIENKIPGISGLATTAVRNIKIGEVENKIPDVIGLVTAAVFKTKSENLRIKFLMLVV